MADRYRYVLPIKKIDKIAGASSLPYSHRGSTRLRTPIRGRASGSVPSPTGIERQTLTTSMWSVVSKLIGSLKDQLCVHFGEGKGD
jgi:hypothetical protein